MVWSYLNSRAQQYLFVDSLHLQKDRLETWVMLVLMLFYPKRCLKMLLLIDYELSMGHVLCFYPMICEQVTQIKAV